MTPSVDKPRERRSLDLFSLYDSQLTKIKTNFLELSDKNRKFSIF